RSVRFHVDHAAVLEALVDGFRADRDFRGFLLLHRDLMLDLFRRSGWDNIRPLKHALAHLHMAFSAVEKGSHYAAAAREAMIKIILPLTFEHEVGALNEKQVRDLVVRDWMAEVAWSIS